MSHVHFAKCAEAGSSEYHIPPDATVESINGALQLETNTYRIVMTRSLAPRHLPFSILTTLIANFSRLLIDESKVYSPDYPIYRDPSYTHEILTIGMERYKESSKPDQQLTYADILLLCAVIKEHLGKIDDEACEIEIFKQGKGKAKQYELVGRGSLGFTKAALMMSDGPTSNTTDVRW